MKSLNSKTTVLILLLLITLAFIFGSYADGIEQMTWQEALKIIYNSIVKIEAKLDRDVNPGIERLEAKLDRIEKKLDTPNPAIQQLEVKLDEGVIPGIQQLEAKRDKDIGEIFLRLDSLEAKLDRLVPPQ